MKKLSLLLLVPVLAFADEIVAPSGQELLDLFNSLGGLKGAGGLVVAMAVSQAVMLFLRSKLGELAGKYRLLAIYLLSVVSGVLVLRVSGVSLGAALVHSQTLAALQVFLNQVLKQFFVKND